MTDPGVRAIIKAMLKQIRGADIVIAVDLNDVLEKAQCRSYDLVVLDADAFAGWSDARECGIDSMQGVIERIRALQAEVIERSRPIPIIGIASCMIGGAGITNISGAGFSAILCKPLTKVSVHAAVRSLLAPEQESQGSSLLPDDETYSADPGAGAAHSLPNDTECHPVRILIVEGLIGLQ